MSRYAPESEADTRSYTSFKTKTEELGLTITHPKPGDTLYFGNSTVEFYGSITDSENDRNNGSVVMKIIYSSTSFLFTGNAEREEKQELLNAGYDLSATVLKVGHHGSRNSTTYPFLREIMPKCAIISVGDNNYRHPTEDTLSRLRNADVKVYKKLKRQPPALYPEEIPESALPVQNLVADVYTKSEFEEKRLAEAFSRLPLMRNRILTRNFIHKTVHDTYYERKVKKYV